MDENERPASSTEEVVEIRRAPRILPFAITGLLVGVALALVLYFSLRAGETDSSILGLLVLALGSASAGLAVLLAIALDLLFSRRPKRVVANKVDL